MQKRAIQPLNRVLRDLFRVEPLEPRVLLSADPVLGAAQLVLSPQDREAAANAALADAYAAGPVVNVATTPGANVLIADNAQQPAGAGSSWLVVDTAQLGAGNGSVVVGGVDSNAVIHVGTAGSTTSVGSSLVLVNPQDGGEIYLDGAVNIAGDLVIVGSGHTTHVVHGADVTTAGSYSVSDSLDVSGTAKVTAGTGGSGSISIGPFLSGNNNSADNPDILTLLAPGDVTIAGKTGVNEFGTSDPLEGLIIGSEANKVGNVSFTNDVVMDGDLEIYATGVVTFGGRLQIHNGGDLKIIGATRVVFTNFVTLDGGAGDVTLQADEIDFATGTENFKGSGVLTMRPTTLTNGIDIGSLPASASQPGGTTLNLETSELRALADGFSKIVIGWQDAGHATPGSGNVRIGAMDQAGQAALHDPLEVYGGTITVQDMGDANYTLLVDGSVVLDARGDITISNRLEAGIGGSASLTLYSETGQVQQVDNAADGVTGEPLMATALTVRAATGISLPYTEISTVSATNVGSGNLSITETATGGDVTVLLLNQQAAAANLSLKTTAGHLTVNGSGVSNAGSGLTELVAAGSTKNIAVNQDIHSGSGTIRLTASGAITTDDDAGGLTHGVIATAGAGNVELTASGGAIQQGADISSLGGALSLDAATGLTMKDGVRATSQNGTGSVNLRARGGNVTVSIVEAAASIGINASGSILDGLTGSNPNLDGETAAVLLAAASGIGTSTAALQTRVNALGAINTGTTSSTGVFVREATALRITAASGSFAVDAGGVDGSVAIYTVDGALTIEKAVRSTGTTGNILLQTGELGEGTPADLALNANVSTNGHLSVLSADGISAGAGAVVAVGSASGTLDVEAASSINASGTSRFATGGGALRMSALGGDLTVGEVNALNATASLSATGRILDAQADDAGGAVTNVSANAVRLSAAGGIGMAGALFDTQVTKLAAASSGGAVYLSELDAVGINSIAAVTVNRVNVQGGIGSNPADAGTLTGLASAQQLVLHAGGNMAIAQAVTATGNLRLDAGGTLDVNATVATTAGSISATSAGAIGVGATGKLAASGGTLEIQSTGGAVIMVDGSIAQTDAATLRVQAQDRVVVGLLDARSAADRAANTSNDHLAWGTVSVVAGAAIADNGGETATDVYGYTVRLQAGGGIGAAGEQLETEAGQMSATAGAAGLFLTEASGLEVQHLATIDVQRVGLDGLLAAGPSDAPLQDGLASGGVLSLQTQLGSIFVGSDAAVAAAGNLLLDAQGGPSDVSLSSAVTSSGGSISIRANRDLSLFADVGTTAAGRTIDLVTQRDLLQAQGHTISTSDGNVAIEAATGTATLEAVSAGSGGVWVSATAIVDGDAAGDTEVDITAASAQLLATAAGIGAAGAALETQVGTLSASAVTGLFVTESDGVTVDRLQLDVNRVGVAGGTAATTHAAQEDLSAATVVLRALAGDIAVNAGTTNTAAVNGAGNVLLEAVAGQVLANGNVSAGSGNASLLGAAGVAFQGTGGVATTGGTVDVQASGGSVTMAEGTVITSAGGAVRLKASGDVVVGVLDAGAGSVSIAADGSILDNAGETSSDVLAAALRLQAGGSIGAAGEALETAVGQLSAIAGAAGLFLTEADGVTVTQTAAVSVNRVGADGTTLTPQTDDAQAGLTSAGVLVLQTTSGTLTSDAQGAISAAGNVYLRAAGATSDLVLGAVVASTGGSLDLSAGRDALVDASLSTATAGKSIAVSAARDVTQAQGTSIATTNGGIWISAGTGTATLEQLLAGSAGVYVSANRIADGDAAGDTEVDIVANRAWLLGSAGIGTAGAELETTVDVLRANGNAGDLFITETDALSLDLVSVAFQIVDANGSATDASAGGDRGLGGRNVVLRTVNGGIASNVNTGIAATGNLLLQAAGAAADLTLAGTTTAGGAATLLAGHDITLSNSVSTTGAGSTLDVEAQGRIDAQQGSALSANNANVQLLAQGGSVTLESVNAGTGTVRLKGTSIVDGDTAGDSEVDITAGKLLATVTGSAGTGANTLETAVGTLSVSAGGLVGIVNSGGLVLDSITTSVNRVGAAGTTTATTPVTQANVSGTTVTIRTLAGALVGTASGGAVTVSGNLLLKAAGGAGDLTLGAAVSSSAGNITLDAARDLTLIGALSTATTGKTIDALAGGKLEQMQGSTLATNNGHVSFAATGTVTVESISAGVGRVNLSGSAIIDGDTAGDTEADVLAAGLRATATAGGIGSSANPLETTISQLSASASGDVFVTETDALDLVSVSATVNRVGNNGLDAPVALGAQNNVSGATVVLRTLGGSLTSQASGVITATGNVLLQAGGATSDLGLAAAVSSSGGNVSLAAGQDVNLSANASTATAGKTIDIVAGRNFTQAQGTAITTVAGNIGLQAGGVATIETLNADLGSVRIAAGSVVDGDTAANETEVDVLGASLQLVTTGAVGSGSNALETTVQSVAAATGNLFLTETDGLSLAALAIDTQRVAADGSSAATSNAATSGVTAATAVVQAKAGSLASAAGINVTASGNLLLKALGAGSDLLLAGNVSGGGDLTLDAARDLVLGGAVAATGAGRSLVLQAGRDFSQAQGGSAGANAGALVVQAVGTATIELLANNGGSTRIAAAAIVDGDSAGDSETDVLAANLLLTATGAIGAAANALETSAGSLSLQAGGDAFLAEDDALVLSTASVTSRRVGADGTSQAAVTDSQSNVNTGGVLVLQTLAGTLSSTATGAVTAGGNLLLAAAGAASDVAFGAAIGSTAGDLSVSAGRDLLLSANAGTAGAGNTIDLFAQRDVLQAQGTQVTSNDGNIALQAATGTATIESLAAGAGGLWVSAAAIVDGDAAGDTEADLSGAAAQLITTGDIGAGGAALETAVATLTAHAGGNIFLTEADGLAIGSAGIDVRRVGVDGTTAATAHSTDSGLAGQVVALRTIDGALAVQAAVAAGGNLLLQAGGAAGDLAVDAATSAGGALSLAAGRDLAIGASVTTSGTTIDLLAQNAIVAAQGSSIASGNANVLLQAGGSVTLESVNAGTGSVRISAASLVDGDTGAGETESDITAAALQISVTGAIGAAANALETTVGTLSAAAGGAITIAESDNLLVGSVNFGGVDRVGADGGVTGTGALAQANVAAGGDVTLATGGTFDVAAAAQVTTTGGVVAIESQGSLGVGAGGVVGTASGRVALTSHAAMALGAQADVHSGGGAVALTAATSFSLGAQGSVDAGGGTITVTAQGGTLALGSESRVASTGGAVTLSATGDLGIGANALVQGGTNTTLDTGGNLSVGDTATVTSLGGSVIAGADGSIALLAHASVSGASGVMLEAGTTLALADAAQVASSGGNIAATAQGDVTMAADSSMVSSGAATIDLTSVTGKVTMDPNTSSLRTGSGDIRVTAEGDIQPGALVTTGQALVHSNAGRVLIRGDLQRNGEDVDLFGDDLVIEVPVSSPGGTLRIGPQNPGTQVIIGDQVPGGPALQVDTGELALLQDGFAQIVIGSGLANQALLLDGATSPLVFHDPLLLNSSGAGGTVAIQGSLSGDSLTIADSGSNTTLRTSRIAMVGPVLVQDQVSVDGANTVAGAGSVRFTQTVTGAGGAADTLAVTADGGTVQMDQAVSNLDGLSISQASDVTFGAAVSLTGDLVIEATGTVTFNGPLTLANGAHLIVRGGGRVVFNGTADLGSGDALLQVSGIAANGGTASLRGTGVLQVQGSSAGQAIHVGAGAAAGGALVVGDDVLRAVGAGFGKLLIGSSATGAAGVLTLGDADLSATGSPVELQGSNIAVVATGAGARVGTSVTLHARGDVTVQGQVLATAAADLKVSSDTGSIAMDSAARVTSAGGRITLDAATGLSVAGLDARGSGGDGTVYLRSATGQILDASGDAAIDVYAQAVDFDGRGTSAGSGAVLEVSAPVVRVAPAGGVVLRESGTDGRVYYNVLRGADLEQALVAVGASQRITTDPDAFIAGGGMGQLAAGSGGSRASALSSALSVSFGTSAGSTNTQVQGYLASLGSVSDPSLTLSERLQAESELSFASGQPAGGTTGVDYWTETLGV